MRSVALKAWHALLILSMVWGLFAALHAAVGRLTSGWEAPGVGWLELLVGLEAIITQRLMARERRRIEEQIGARGLELVVIILLARLWSLWAEPGPLLDTIGPWLRSPLLFFGGRFPEYFVWALLAWLVATILAGDVIEWGNDMPVQATFAGSIEREQLQQEWGQTIARYDRRYLVIVLLTFAASAFVLHTSAGDASDSVTPSALVAAAVVSLIAGLLLHSAGRLSQLYRNWAVDDIAIDTSVSRRWSRPVATLLLGLVLCAPLLGLLVLVIPPPPLIPVANFILVGLTVLISVIFLLLLSPLILLLSLLRGTAPNVPSSLMFQPPQIPDAQRSERPLVPALIFWGCVALLIGIALWRYMQGRSDLREALRRSRILGWLFWVARALGGWWSDARGWAALATMTIARRLRRQRKRQLPVPLPHGSQAQLRQLYRRMKEAGARRGVASGVAQTPYEYGSALATHLPPVEQDVRGLTEAYVLGEYGPHPTGPAELQRARQHWRRIQGWLLRSMERKPRRRTQGRPRG